MASVSPEAVDPRASRACDLVPDQEALGRASQDLVKALSSSPDSVRACRVFDLLHGWGSIFGESCGSEATYRLSRPAKRIDLFFSHNWSTGRVPKFMALAMHFNLVPAMVVTTIAQVVCSALVLAGKLPHLPCSSGRTGIVGLALSGPVFFYVLFFWHELPGLRSSRTPGVFLDKACINQTDEDEKQKGIQHIGMTLRLTSKLFVCYSHLYLRKLWTMYELASFICMHPTSSIVLQPTFMPVSILSGIGLAYVSNFLVFCFESELEEVRVILILAIQCLATSVLMRHNALARARVYRAVSEFSIQSAQCAHEPDRALVEGNAIDLLRSCGFLDGSESRDEALQKFDQLVVQHMPDVVIASLGHVGMKYREALSLGIMVCVPSYLDSYAAYLLRFSPENRWWFGSILIAQAWTHSSALVPLVIAILTYITRCGISGGPSLQAMVVLLAAAVAFMCVALVCYVDYWVFQLEYDEPASHLPRFLTYASLHLLAALVYGRPRPWQVAASRPPVQHQPADWLDGVGHVTQYTQAS